MPLKAYDHIVIGGGGSGCALAARLSQALPEARIALIEAGPRARSPLLSVPALGGFAPFVHADLNWNHPTAPNPDIEDRSVPLLQGRLLGGSGAINGMVMTRGHPGDYDAWRDGGCPGWGFSDLLPYFRRLETHWRGASHWHGGDGPVPVRRSTPHSDLPAHFLKAARTAGFALTDDLNAGQTDVFGLTDVNIGNGVRQSTATAYLGKIARPNLDILTDNHVLRLLIGAGRVNGVEVSAGGRIRSIGAEASVTLCCGSINTAHLLMVSGIGPADELKGAGVTPRLDAPAVGRNLQNHPSMVLRYCLAKPLSLSRHLRPDRAMAAAARYIAGRTGMLAEGLFPVAGFVRTRPDLERPDAQIVMSPVVMPPLPAPLRAMVPRRHGLTLIVQQGTPFSRGRLRLVSADPRVRPVIETGAFSDPRDLEVMADAAGIARTIMSQPVWRGIVAEPETDRTRSQEIAAIRSHAGTAYHQCGTCRMGTDEAAVVDPQLRVRGMDGLYIVDGSIIPLIPNAALHAPTIMIAERAATLIAAGKT